MSFDNAILELRQLLADSVVDKKATKKKIIGATDGNNTTFFTYDKRIFGDTFVAYVNGDVVTADVVDEVTGEISLAAAPDVNTSVQASYYWKFFLDDELMTFLNRAAESCGVYNDAAPDESFLMVPQGMKKAAIYFAASDCTKRLVSLMNNRKHSEEFLIEQDGNDDSNYTNSIKALQDQAKTYWDQAIWLRDDYYLGQGKRNAPSFAVKPGVTRKYGAIR